MDDQAFDILVSKLREVISRITSPDVDSDSIISSMTNAIMRASTGLETIDYEAISPVSSPMHHSGHELIRFTGMLPVPEIEKYHDVTPKTPPPKHDMSVMPGLLLPLLTLTLPGVTNIGSLTAPVTVTTRGKKQLNPGKGKQSPPIDTKSTTRRTLKSRPSPIYAPRVTSKLSPSTASVDTQINSKWTRALKNLTRLTNIAGITITVVQMNHLRQIYSDTKLTDDQKTQQTGPIIGEILGAYGGAVIGGMVGTAIGPWGTFIGALVGGVTGSLSGHELGAVISRYITDEQPPVHPSGRSWSDLTSQEIESWVRSDEQRLSHTDSSSTKVTQLNQPETESKPLTYPLIDIHQSPDTHKPTQHQVYQSIDGAKQVHTSDTDITMPGTTQSQKPAAHSTVTQAHQTNSMLTKYLTEIKKHNDVKKQLITQIEQISNE